MFPLRIFSNLQKMRLLADLICARVRCLKSCLLIIKPLLFPGLDGCGSVALVYAWRVSREKISRKPGALRVWVCDSDTRVTIHKAEAERSARDQGQEV